MKYRVLTIGRRADDPLLAAAEVYRERLARFVPVEVVRMREGTPAGERDELLGALRPAERVIALDEHGRERSTVELAEAIARWQRGAVRAIAFLIGGADGMHREVKERADESWSLSRLTLPHRLALVLLLEQLYRAHSILRGDPYHRA